MPYGNINVDTVTTTTPGGILGGGNASLMKNRIINGAMVIAQRGTSSSDPANGQYLVDRFQYNLSTTGKISTSQSSTAPTGFTKSLLATSSSAYSVSSTDYFTITQPIEGFNVADLGWGTASAKTVTLSAWVYSSLTGTFGGSIMNGAFNYAYPFTYSIPTANTWTQISVTIAGPTAGTWPTDNSSSVQVNFSLGAGSTRSGTAGSWTGSLLFSATGATSVVGTSGATFYITGVQLEVGSSATGFEYRHIGTETALCQRYYIRYANGTGQRLGVGDRYASTFIQCMTFFPTEMRTAPTLVATTGSGYYVFYQAGTAHTFNSFTLDSGGTTTKIAVMYNSGDTSATAGQCGMYQTNNASGSIAFSAEL